MITKAIIRRQVESNQLTNIQTFINVEIWFVWARWTNVFGHLSSGPHSRSLGEFSTQEKANVNKTELFQEWRKKNPESDGQRSHAWSEVSK